MRCSVSDAAVCVSLFEIRRVVWLIGLDRIGLRSGEQRTDDDRLRILSLFARFVCIVVLCNNNGVPGRCSEDFQGLFNIRITSCVFCMHGHSEFPRLVAASRSLYHCNCFEFTSLACTASSRRPSLAPPTRLVTWQVVASLRCAFPRVSPTASPGFAAAIRLPGISHGTKFVMAVIAHLFCIPARARPARPGQYLPE